MASNNPPKRRPKTKLVLLAIAATAISVGSANHWFQKARSTVCNSACVNNLRQIEGAKDQWAIEFRQTNGAIPSVSDITPYIKFGLPICPEHGTYIVNPIGKNATCSLAGRTDVRGTHELP